jgi:type IV secretory pathway ATPase VirB11/archaellum biosynthesis ATPase
MECAKTHQPCGETDERQVEQLRRQTENVHPVSAKNPLLIQEGQQNDQRGEVRHQRCLKRRTAERTDQRAERKPKNEQAEPIQPYGRATSANGPNISAF